MAAGIHRQHMNNIMVRTNMYQYILILAMR